jgi:hypothetical protein
VSARLERVERIIDASHTAERVEALLPVGVRPRQLRVRTLMVGMVLAMLAGRDALLTNVLHALLELPETERRRLGVIALWNDAEHRLTYRQLEYTYRLISHLAERATRHAAELAGPLDECREGDTSWRRRRLACAMAAARQEPSADVQHTARRPGLRRGGQAATSGREPRSA